MAIPENMVVSFEYSLREQGTTEVIDSNVGKSPLEFIMGKNNIIPGLERELANYEIGQSGVVCVEPVDAYGIYHEDGCVTHPADQFEDLDLFAGMTLYGQAEDGSTVQVVVKSFDEKEVVVDYNHPLAGKTLEFEVTVLSSREATDFELEQGAPMSAGGGCGCSGGGDHHGHDHSHKGGCGC